MTSKRNLKRDVEELSEESASETEFGLCIFTCGNRFETREESSRPELLVPDEQLSGYTMGLPNVIPEGYETPIMFLSAEVRETWPEPASDDDSTVSLPKLWDTLTEEQLQEEYHIRRETGEAIPPLLEQYGTE